MRRSAMAAMAIGVLTTCAVVRAGSTRVTVTGSGRDLSLSPRPASCRVEFYRTKAPERAYDEVATLHVSGSRSADAADMQEIMRARACELGADAVIVTRDYLAGVNLMTGTAVSYPELREVHRARHARTIAEWRSAIAALQRPPGLPSSYVPARTKREVTLLSGLDANASFEIGTVAAGQLMWVAPDPTQTYREVMTAGGRDAYADDDALEFAPAEATSAEPPAGAPPEGRPGAAPRPQGTI